MGVKQRHSSLFRPHKFLHIIVLQRELFVSLVQNRVGQRLDVCLADNNPRYMHCSDEGGYHAQAADYDNTASDS